jgi:hypothetical protein
VNALFSAAAGIEAFCIARGWRCAVIGGLAVQRWGEPRQTRDVDLTILTGLGGEERFVDPLLAEYRPRIPDARRFAIERRVLLLETSSGVPLDVSLGGLPYEARVIDRSTVFANRRTPRRSRRSRDHKDHEGREPGREGRRTTTVTKVTKVHEGLRVKART